MQIKLPKRNVIGILLLNKPQGITSNFALQQVKRIFNASKAGHTGSLDPLATGMLPICFGEATKFSQYLLDADKSYRVVMQLGVQTTTGDAEGEIVANKPVPHLTLQYLQEILLKFVGEITQVPSMYSALKHQGQPLYKLARAGITVERKARHITIYEIKLLSVNADKVTLEVRCSKGTYIRTLVEDIGYVIGCGAHVVALYRISVANFSEAQMHEMTKLDELNKQHDTLKLDGYLLPLESILQPLPTVELTTALLYYVRQGQAVLVPNAPTKGLVRLFASNKFWGIGEILDDGRVKPKRLINA